MTSVQCSISHWASHAKLDRSGAQLEPQRTWIVKGSRPINETSSGVLGIKPAKSGFPRQGAETFSRDRRGCEGTADLFRTRHSNVKFRLLQAQLDSMSPKHFGLNAPLSHIFVLSAAPSPVWVSTSQNCAFIIVAFSVHPAGSHT